jgi:hypothetical protein
MLVPACGSGRARAECPRAGRSPLEGGVYPRAGRSPLEGGVCPRAKRSLLEGTFEWATSVGRGRHRGVGRAPCAHLNKMRLALVFCRFYVGFPPVVSGDPQGCPRHVLLSRAFPLAGLHAAAAVLPRCCRRRSPATAPAKLPPAITQW